MSTKLINRTLLQVTLDVARQLISLAPILYLYLVSKEDVYLSIAILTSSTTLVSSMLLLGVNFLVLLPERASFIRISTRYLILVSPIATVFSLGIFLTIDARDNFTVLMTSLFLFGEVLFTLVQQSVARYALAEWKVKSILVANIASPTFRAAAFLSCAIEEFQFAAGIFHFFSQALLTFLVIRFAGISKLGSPMDQANFKRLLGVGVPNWLSSLAVTALDNLSVLFIAYYAEAPVAATLILILRVIGAANSPIQSVAAFRLTRKSKGLASEVKASFVFGLSSIFGTIGALYLVERIPASSEGKELLVFVSTLLILWPMFRTINTFIANFLTQIGKPWVRVWSGYSSLIISAFCFALVGFDKNAVGNFNILSTPVVLGEITLLMGLSLGLVLARQRAHNFR